MGGNRIFDPRVKLPKGYVSPDGLILSNGTDADHDIDLTVGECRDDGDSADIVLASALTKQADVLWAVGTNAGGRDTGTLDANKIYYQWMIKRTDTGVVDSLMSLSGTSPTMPANYDKKQLIGAVKTDGTSDIRPFIQTGNFFLYTAGPVSDVNDNTITDIIFETGTLSAPRNSLALIYAENSNFTSTEIFGWIQVKRKGNSDGTSGSLALVQNFYSATFDQLGGQALVAVDGNSQMEYVAPEGSGSASVQVRTIGFIMNTRGAP